MTTVAQQNAQRRYDQKRGAATSGRLTDEQKAWIEQHRLADEGLFPAMKRLLGKLGMPQG